MGETYNHYELRRLAIQINQAIIDNDGLIGNQREQVELLFSLERKFQFYAQKYTRINGIYNKFIDHITINIGNILSAKPYFREKSTTFSKRIAPVIKDKRGAGLAQFNINYPLIKFIVENWGGNLPEKVNRYYQEYIEARRILIENNIPLAINRAKLFYRKVPRSHLGLIDMIDICICGLINGIDKYVGEYREVWRSVCIGRMVGDMIGEYSKTFIYLYPIDKKILYRINSLRFKMELESIEDITREVNLSFEEDARNGMKIPKLPISNYYISSLLNSTGYTSSSTSDSNVGAPTPLGGCCGYTYASDSTQHIEENIIQNDLLDGVTDCMKDLTLVETKILKLKGELSV